MSIPIVGDHPATTGHRGVFRIDGALPALSVLPTLTYEPVRGRIWTISEGIYRTIFVEGDHGITAFDSFSSPGAAVAYRQALDRLFPDKPIDKIIYSHDHLDHSGYSADLAPKAAVLAHQECAVVVEARRADGQLVPTQTWDTEEFDASRDSTELMLINPGATHGSGNLAAYFPAERVLFMVDTVIPGVGYTFLPDWHLDSFAPNMRRLLDLDWDLFVPGHFWCLDRSGFRENIEYFEFLAQAGRDALRQGVDPDDSEEVDAFARSVHQQDFGHLFRFEEYFALNLMRMMLHARTGGWGLEDAQPAALPPASGAQPSLTSIAGNVNSITAGDHRMLVIEGEQSLFLANSFGDTAAVESARRLLAEHWPQKPVSGIVATIDHLNHVAALAELAPEADLFVHPLVADALRRRDVALPSSIRQFPADRWLVHLDGIDLEFWYPGPTVGVGNTAVWLPRQRVLYMVGPRADARYGLFPDWQVEQYVPSLRRLLDLPVEKLAPGRGPLGDGAGFATAIEYFEALQYATQKAFAEGVAVWDRRAVEEYVMEVLRGTYDRLDGFRRHVGVGALRVVHHYLMGGWGIEDSQAPDELARHLAGRQT